MNITTTDWHGLRAYVLESERLRAVVLPTMGAKFASLVDKHTQREWLLQPASLPPQREIPYGTPFDRFEIYGWDEMFPTLHDGNYPEDGPYLNAFLPDHGEVWPLAWLRETSGFDKLALSVNGRVLPYRLVRTVAFDGPDALRLHYTVTNTGAKDFIYLWAPHPLFAVDAQTEIVLPSSVEQVVNVHAMAPWGAHGLRYAWPNARTLDGRTWDLRRVGPTTLRDCRKFYVPPEQSVDWAGLRQSDCGAWLRLEWDSSALPYLGIWIDEGIWATAPTVTLEPTNGFYDSLTMASDNHRIQRLSAGETRFWDVTVRLNNGSAPIEK